MHTRLPQHLLIVFFSSLLQQVNSSVISCLRSSTTDRGHQRVTFLREDAAGARSLFRTVWLSDAATMRMLSCRISKNPGDVEHYQTAVCDSSLEDLSLTRFVNVSVMNEVDTNCAPQKKMRSRAREEAVVKIRRKRGWIFPGTLWCGMNTKAATYDELGMFENADSCCREHDHCEHTIPSFTVNYGVFNPNLYTLSHCDCDQSFRKCLLGVNDTISTMVGYSFFNILRVPCFELKEQQQCTKMYWWGMCKVTRKAPYAVLKTSHLYNSSHVSTNEANSNNSNNSKETKHEEKQTTKITGINMQQKSPKIQSRCRSRDPPRGDTFYQRKKGKRCKINKMMSATVNITASSATTGRSSTSLRSDLVTGSKNVGVKKSSGRLSEDSYPQASPTTQNVPSSTGRQTTYQQRPLVNAFVPQTIKKHIAELKKSHCCESLRGNTFWPFCKNCSNAETTVVTAATTMTEAPQTSTTPGPVTTSGETNTFTAPATTKPKVTDNRHGDRKLQNRTDSFLFKTHLNQRSRSRTSENNTIAQDIFKENHTVSDHELLCKSLKHLDECRHQITPLEKKYGLWNKESKTVYHCNCTTRLSVHIRNFRRLRVLPSLLTDFVSEQCFKLPKENKCQDRKSCSRFIKAYDLIRRLKKMKTKGTAWSKLPGSDQKRGIPVRLYKRCLRLERGIDNVEQLTW